MSVGNFLTPESAKILVLQVKELSGRSQPQGQQHSVLLAALEVSEVGLSHLNCWMCSHCFESSFEKKLLRRYLHKCIFRSYSYPFLPLIFSYEGKILRWRRDLKLCQMTLHLCHPSLTLLCLVCRQPWRMPLEAWEGTQTVPEETICPISKGRGDEVLLQRSEFFS